jgi:hypothetical protein
VHKIGALYSSRRTSLRPSRRKACLGTPGLGGCEKMTFLNVLWDFPLPFQTTERSVFSRHHNILQ